MKKILIFGVFLAFFNIASVDAAVRDGTTNARTKSGQVPQQRISTTPRVDTNRATPVRQSGGAAATRSATTKPATRTPANSSTRAKTFTTAQASRSATTSRSSKMDTQTKPATTRGITAGSKRTKNARAATDTTGAITMSETRTGAAYEQCKAAYFQCMDQFCSLKNEEYRRCSCSDRVLDLADVRENLTQTNSKLTEFTENLDVVGMTAAQATAIHTASDGENALIADTSASKALLQAIMNSIRGEDTTVGGKMSDLNSINISFDTANAFGITDSAQVVASYNGSTLYRAVYPSCRDAVKSDCTDASLQRAVTAYLMSIEQDCNTVQTALTNKQKELKAAVREGSAMLDLARIENRKKHNSDNFTACLGNVESAILSEEVCGSDYHKCLDNGEYIDVTTGAPIAGVTGFANLGHILTFAPGVEVATDQKLSMVQENKKFVTSFENKTKKFAADALDKCSEISDSVWSEYLDKALLAIYYAQQSKVDTIKTGCFDLITACYNDRNASITAAMKELIDGTTETSLIPSKITLTQTMCDDYIQSCNGMFDGDIIDEYVQNQKDTDTLAACRAVAQQCFTKYGGANYENFYYPSSGLFQPNTVDATELELGNDFNTIRTALDWFSLYEYDEDDRIVMEADNETPKYKSPCAQEVAQIPSCAEQIETVFGGLDSIHGKRSIDVSYDSYVYGSEAGEAANGYGWVMGNNPDSTAQVDYGKFTNRRLRPTGVATEVYNQIIDILQTQCMNMNGKFVEAQYVKHVSSIPSCFITAIGGYGLAYLSQGSDEPQQENICPKNYLQDVDTDAWGVCSCWENGGRRSKGGLISKCMPIIPVWPTNDTQTNAPNDAECSENYNDAIINQINAVGMKGWCLSDVDTATDRVKPISGSIPEDVPYGINATMTPDQN
ncbi:MAG: hypothetical protein IJR92_01345 [Alphaproteobacteria bacterium]|nr:hypothetical protein [Alphaproteobacteria bacterium]